MTDEKRAKHHSILVAFSVTAALLCSSALAALYFLSIRGERQQTLDNATHLFFLQEGPGR